MDVYQLIKFHEGFRAKAYRDTRGILTIGYGQRVDEMEITENYAAAMMTRRVMDLGQQLLHVDGFEVLNEVRQAVILDMAYQLGLDGLLKFNDMWRALELQDYEAAADAMLKSNWALQTPVRAAQLANMMRTGDWPADFKS